MLRAPHVALVIVGLLLLPGLLVTSGATVPADVSASGGAVVFSFDYGFATGVDAAAALEAHGARGTFYVMSSALREGPYYTDFLSAQEVAALSTRGHQIASQSVTGTDLTTLDPASLTERLSSSKFTLEAITGLPVAHLAYPFGATNDDVIAATQPYYFSGRTVTWSVHDFLLPLEAYRLPALIVDRATSLDTAKGYIDFARANNVTVILEFQRIAMSPGANDWSTANFTALLDHLVARGVPSRTIGDIFPTPAPILPQAPAINLTVVNTSALVEWTAPINGGGAILGYNIYRGTVPGQTTLRATTAGDVGRELDTNLTFGATYYYQVSATNAAGEGPRSEEFRARVAMPGYTPGTIVFTFDRGFATGVETGALLEARGMRGTFYVVTQNMRQGPYFTDFLSAQELANLSKAGHDIQSQTVTAPDLTLISADRVATELAVSKEKIQSIVGMPVTHLAYPFGATNASVIAAMSGSFASGRTVTTDINTFLSPLDPMRVPGLMITQATSLAQAKSFVDFAIENNVTVIFDLQRISTTPGALDWSRADFAALLDHAAARKVPVKTISQIMPTAEPIRPIPPQATAAVVNGAIEINWTAPPTGGSPITGYTISRGVSPLLPTISVVLPPGATSWRDTNITQATSYDYVISATNAVGEGARSANMRATLRAPGVSPGAIVLAFDDSSADHLAVSKQLETYGWRGTFFVVTQTLSAKQSNAWDATLTKKNVQAMAKAGHDMEAHTLTHTPLTALTLPQAEREMAVSRLELENITGKTVRHFAYPESAFNGAIEALASKYFSSARAMATNLEGSDFDLYDRYAVPSIGIQRGDTDLAKAKSYVDLAIAQDRTIILTFHRIVVDNDPWDLDPATFKGLLEHIKAKKVTVMTYAQFMG